MFEYDWLLTALIYGLVGCFILPLRQAANLTPPCIPVKFSFSFRFVVFTLCVVVSGSEEVLELQSHFFRTMDEGTAETFFSNASHNANLTPLS